MHTKTKTALLSAALLTTLTLSACGSEDGDAASGDHNDQDVAFATEMIPHHAQAVQMSEIATDNASSPEVVDLAEEIRAAQGPEIEQMTSWLEEWGEDVPDTDGMGDMGGMGGMDGMEDMTGMMSPGEMEELADASGAAFDVRFLTMMIEHHEGAIEMAQTEQADGEYADAVELAETIEETQTREIATMEDLLASM